MTEGLCEATGREHRLEFLYFSHGEVTYACRDCNVLVFVYEETHGC